MLQAVLDLQAQVAQLSKLTAAQEEMIAELKHLTDRQEHLIAELRHARFGKKSEKLSEDERQLAFEDLEIAAAETQEAIDQLPAQESKSQKAAKRNRGHLPAHLPRIEQVIETCKLNGVDPYDYLRDTLTAIAQAHPAARIDELMPWAYPKMSSQ